MRRRVEQAWGAVLSWAVGEDREIDSIDLSLNTLIRQIWEDVFLKGSVEQNLNISELRQHVSAQRLIVGRTIRLLNLDENKHVFIHERKGSPRNEESSRITSRRISLCKN